MIITDQPGPRLVCPGCGSLDVDLRRGLLCGTCAEDAEAQRGEAMNWDDYQECGARHDDVTSIACQRPAGHQGDHEGTTTVTWSDDD